MLNTKVSPFVSVLVLVTFGLVASYMAWQSYLDRNNVITPKETLKGELASLPVPQGSEAVGELKLVDRQTFYNADQYYYSLVGRETVAQSYKDALRANGWRLEQERSDQYHVLWFCKNGVLASVAFFEGGDTLHYKLGLTTGGWAIKVCG